MKHSKRKGHRRAKSYYKFNFGEIGVETANDAISTQPSENLPNSDHEEILSSLKTFKNPPKQGEEVEKKIIVEPLDYDFYDENRQNQGLKFTRFQERTETGMRILCPELIPEEKPIQRSPQSVAFKNRLEMLKHKYDGSLQKIEEDIHEMSLAQSRNSIALKSSAKNNFHNLIKTVVHVNPEGHALDGSVEAVTYNIKEMEAESEQDEIEIFISDEDKKEDFKEDRKPESGYAEEGVLLEDVGGVEKDVRVRIKKNNKAKSECFTAYNQQIKEEIEDSRSKIGLKSRASVNIDSIKKRKSRTKSGIFSKFRKNGLRQLDFNTDSISSFNDKSCKTQPSSQNKFIKVVKLGKKKRDYVHSTLKRIYKSRLSNHKRAKSNIMTRSSIKSSKWAKLPLKSTHNFESKKVYFSSFSSLKKPFKSSRQTKRKKPKKFLKNFEMKHSRSKKADTFSEKKSKRGGKKGRSNSINQVFRKKPAKWKKASCNINKKYMLQMKTINTLKSRIKKIKIDSRIINKKYKEMRKENNRLKKELHTTRLSGDSIHKQIKQLEGKLRGLGSGNKITDN